MVRERGHTVNARKAHSIDGFRSMAELMTLSGRSRQTVREHIRAMKFDTYEQEGSLYVSQDDANRLLAHLSELRNVNRPSRKGQTRKPAPAAPALHSVPQTGAAIEAGERAKMAQTGKATTAEQKALCHADLQAALRRVCRICELLGNVDDITISPDAEKGGFTSEVHMTVIVKRAEIMTVR